MKKIIKDISHYGSLFALLIVGFAGLILFSYDKNLQMIISLALATGYVTWGIIHHILHKDFHIEIAVEYVAVALLGLIILFSLVIRV